MPFASTVHQTWWTGDATTDTWLPDFSALVMAPPLPGADITLWPIIGKAADGTEPTKYEWVEEELSQLTLTLGEALDATETEIEFAAGEIAAAGLRAGAVLKNATDKTKIETIYVSSVDDSTTATVIRDYGGLVSGSGGGATGQTHASADELEIIGYLNPEGSSVTKTDYFSTRDRSLKYNYYSILDDWNQISIEDMVRVYRGSSPDNWGYQLSGLKQRLDRQFERHIASSPMVQRTTTARGSMGGLIWFATQSTGASGNSYVTTADTFDYEVFDDGMKYLYEKGTLDGGHDIVCLMPPAGIQAAAYVHASAQQGEYLNETVRGLRCTTLMSTITGDRIPLVPCNSIPSDSFMLLNLNAVRIHFLKGLALTVFNKEPGQELDAYRAARLYSNITMEFQRPVENCYFHTGMTYNRS